MRSALSFLLLAATAITPLAAQAQDAPPPEREHHHDGQRPDGPRPDGQPRGDRHEGRPDQRAPQPEAQRGQPQVQRQQQQAQQQQMQAQQAQRMQAQQQQARGQRDQAQRQQDQAQYQRYHAGPAPGQRTQAQMQVQVQDDRRDGRGQYRGDQYRGDQYRGGPNGDAQRSYGERDGYHGGRPGYDDRGRDDRNGQRYGNGYADNRGQWNRGWRQDRSYDWRGYRNGNRALFRAPRYFAPRGYEYRRWSVGSRIEPFFYARSYWISDPWRYRLPPAYGPYRWVRYYDDVLLVDLSTGIVVDSISDFFWQ